MGKITLVNRSWDLIAAQNSPKSNEQNVFGGREHEGHPPRAIEIDRGPNVLEPASTLHGVAESNGPFFGFDGQNVGYFTRQKRSISWATFVSEAYNAC